MKESMHVSRRGKVMKKVVVPSRREVKAMVLQSLLQTALRY